MSEQADLLSLSPADFISFLKKENILKFYFVYDDVKKKMASAITKVVSILHNAKNVTTEYNSQCKKE